MQIANAGAAAPKLIKEYSADALYQFRDAVDKAAGQILASNAGYSIGTAASPQAITKDTLISFLAKMKTKFTRGNGGTAWQNGKMSAILPPEMIELLTQTGAFQYTESGFTNMKNGEVAKIAGWNIVQSNNTPVNGNTYYKKIQLPLSEKFKNELDKIGIKESGFVFVSHRTKEQYKKIYNGFQEALKRAGINKMRFHDLRHTVATRLVANGADLRTVKEYMAHSNIRTTERYMHPTPENMLKAVDILDSF